MSEVVVTETDRISLIAVTGRANLSAPRTYCFPSPGFTEEASGDAQRRAEPRHANDAHATPKTGEGPERQRRAEEAVGDERRRCRRR